MEQGISAAPQAHQANASSSFFKVFLPVKLVYDQTKKYLGSKKKRALVTFETRLGPLRGEILKHSTRPANDSHPAPPLQAFAALLDAQPGPVQVIFQYCLTMLMVEVGQAALIKTEPGQAGTCCTFQTEAGTLFTMLKPSLSEAQEQEMAEKLREIFVEDL